MYLGGISRQLGINRIARFTWRGLLLAFLIAALATHKGTADTRLQGQTIQPIELPECELQKMPYATFIPLIAKGPPTGIGGVTFLYASSEAIPVCYLADMPARTIIFRFDGPPPIVQIDYLGFSLTTSVTGNELSVLVGQTGQTQTGRAAVSTDSAVYITGELTLLDNTPPVASLLVSENPTHNVPFTLIPQAADASGIASFTVQEAERVIHSGLSAFTQVVVAPSIHSYQFTAIDGAGNTLTQEVWVSITNQPPSISAPTDLYVELYQDLTIPITILEPNGDNYVKKVTGPFGVGVTMDDQNIYVPGLENKYLWNTIPITATVTDAYSGVAQKVINLHVDDTVPPRVLSLPTQISYNASGSLDPISTLFSEVIRGNSFLQYNIEIRDEQYTYACQSTLAPNGREAITTCGNMPLGPKKLEVRYIQDLAGNYLDPDHVVGIIDVVDQVPPIPAHDLQISTYADLWQGNPDAQLTAVNASWISGSENTYIGFSEYLYGFLNISDAEELDLDKGIIICAQMGYENIRQGCNFGETILPLGLDIVFRLVQRDSAGNASGSNIVVKHLETLAEYAILHHLVPETFQTLDYNRIFADSLEGRAFILHDTWRLAGYLAGPYMTGFPNAQQVIYSALLSYVDGTGLEELTVDINRPSVTIAKPDLDGVNRVTFNLSLTDGREVNQIYEGFSLAQIEEIRSYLSDLMFSLINSNPSRYQLLLPDNFGW